MSLETMQNGTIELQGAHPAAVSLRVVRVLLLSVVYSYTMILSSLQALLTSRLDYSNVYVVHIFGLKENKAGRDLPQEIKTFDVLKNIYEYESAIK